MLEIKMTIRIQHSACSTSTQHFWAFVISPQTQGKEISYEV